MKSLPPFLGRCLFAGVILVSQSFAQERSIRFFGNGYQSPGADRVKIPLDSSGANVSMDFTIECWLKCDASENNGNVSYAGHGDGWITGNVFLDRDVYGNADPGDYGFSIGSAPGLPVQTRVVAFGINRKGEGYTIQGRTHIADGKWHHMALTRNGTTGEIRLFIDGKPDAAGRGPSGDISYPAGRHTSYPDSDPFLVVGAEKHDGGGAYPSYNGKVDELRISRVIRYKNEFIPQLLPFSTDVYTAALYHFDEGEGATARDFAPNDNSSSNGIINLGGDPPGPVWNNDSPFESANATTISDVKAQKSKNGVLLSWKAVSGLAEFEVQRSRDGKNFTTIEKIVEPDCDLCEHRYTDTHPFDGKNHYRIKFRSAGKEAFTHPVSVTRSPEVQPYRISQEGSSLVVRNNSTIASLVIWNSDGKRVAEKKMIPVGSTRLPLVAARGMVFIHITLEDGTRFTEKLLLR